MQARYLTTSMKPLWHSTSTESSSTRKNACSASQPKNCSGIWFPPEESKQTPKRPKQSPGCKNQQTSKAYNSLQEDSQHRATSSAGWEKGPYHSTSCSEKEKNSSGPRKPATHSPT